MAYAVLDCPGCGRARALTREGFNMIRSGRNSGFCRSCSRRAVPLTTLEERFFARVQISEGCWLWTGAKNNNGYGMLRRSGTGNQPRVLAHRASWELHRGEIPDGQHVLHHCDNPPCVNPAHLWLGDARANALDMVAKGRARNGR